MASDPIADHARRDFMRMATGGLVGLALAARPHVAVAQAPGSPLKIGMIGAGREGGALGRLFVKAGHPVMFSSRHPDDLKGLVIPYTAMEQIGKAHAGALAKKALVMDVSNPIPRRDGEDFVKSVNDQGGAGLVTAKVLPGAPIVRAFNAIGSGRLGEIAHRQGAPVGVPIAGDDPKAIAVAESLIREIGFEPVLVGGLAMGKHLVPGTPLGGEHTPAEIRQIAPSLR